MLTKEIELFVQRYVEDIQNNSAAFFVGAGFSMEAGFVNWNELVRKMSSELGLDASREEDLVSLAQFVVNKNGNRSIVNNIIFNEFSKKEKPTENHQILASIPIHIIWTTNYDNLIECAFQNCGKTIDVKSCNQHFSQVKPRQDCILYKMHGDRETPSDVVLIKEDYEHYENRHRPFMTALTNDLISKSFLFVGFSFKDPNISYILSRVKVNYEQNSRQHYAIMKRVRQDDFRSAEEFEVEKNRTNLFLDDLKRYNIKPILINDYSEITEILRTIKKRLNVRNVFISGSASEYGDFGEEQATYFLKQLSKRLIQQKFNIISGFGLGIGSSVIAGALEEIYMYEKTINKNRLLLRPFPQGDDVKKLWKRYREDMISDAGIAVFVFGNKKCTAADGSAASVVIADGVDEEFNIAFEHHSIVIPVGCTGYKAKELWERVNKDINKFYPDAGDEVCELFEKLNMNIVNLKDVDDLIEDIMKMIHFFAH